MKPCTRWYRRAQQRKRREGDNVGRCDLRKNPVLDFLWRVLAHREDTSLHFRRFGIPRKKGDISRSIGAPAALPRSGSALLPYAYCRRIRAWQNPMFAAIPD